MVLIRKLEEEEAITITGEDFPDQAMAETWDEDPSFTITEDATFVTQAKGKWCEDLQENKDAVLGGFLDLGQLKKICSRHNLDFIGRRGLPIVSQIENGAAPSREQSSSYEVEQSSSSSSSDNIDKITMQVKMTTPSLANLRVEDNAQFIDMSELQASNKVSLVFGGTDYGLATMSKTAPLTTGVIQTHFNRFQLLSVQIPIQRVSKSGRAASPKDPMYMA
ncbi:MAG: hypothetical protein J3Q66DRAFT_368302 [Benniella sp.]|nr:MAG: hypothetical protein J3Q66DRAFT_368302 [Benniella sp.]